MIRVSVGHGCASHGVAVWGHCLSAGVV